MELTPELEGDLGRLLAYNWQDEQRDYEENPDENHIFRCMLRLQSALEGREAK